MKRINIQLLSILSLAVILFSCSKPYYEIPNRSIDNYINSDDSINTKDNEVGAFQRPAAKNCSQAYNKEYAGSANSTSATDGVLPSYKFFESYLGRQFAEDYKKDLAYLTKSLEAVSFLTAQNGYAAFSHSPDSSYAEFMELPFAGGIGGTDLFEFDIVNNKPSFKALPNEVNSVFWDSHPFIGADSLCNLVIVFSSDRENPYSVTQDLNGDLISKGNTDLYYAFKKNGVWKDAKKFDTINGINTDKFNEITPFISCFKVSPRLFFSSNRNKDYDIYYADIYIDFENEIITTQSDVQMPEKGSEADLQKEFINTYSNEMFPYIAYPFYNNSQTKSLYISSNRNQTAIKRAGGKQDTLVVSKGRYDLYKFNYDMECIVPPPPPPPPVPVPKLNVTLVDKITGKPIISPLVKLVNINTSKETVITGKQNVSFNLEPNSEYLVLGGSERNAQGCTEPGDSILLYYQAKLITKLEPEIKTIKTKVEYDSIVNPTLKTAFDTVYVTEYHPVTSVVEAQVLEAENEKTEQGREITVSKEEAIKNVKMLPCSTPCDPVIREKLKENLKPEQKLEEVTQIMEISKQVVTKREWFEGGKTIKKFRTDISYDTIAKIDTTFIPAIGPAAKSELTHLATITTYSTNDTTINDIVELYPQYYIKPPCSVDFISIEHPYNKNVPYFQTAFWKVNTKEGLKDHLQDFAEENYLARGTFIELHPKNRIYYQIVKGHDKIENRDSLKILYKDYAQTVDLSLNAMRDEITVRFIPAMEALDTLQEGNKVLIKMEAYSDVRSAGTCHYIGNKINYTAGKADNARKVFSFEDISISGGASLNSDNDNLSKLRAYFGWLELFDRLKRDKKFLHYFNKGLVFYPTRKFENDAERDEALKNAKIIILAEGRQADPIVKSDIRGYDPVRRINLHIDLIRYDGEYIEKAPCCDPNMPTIPIK